MRDRQRAVGLYAIGMVVLLVIFSVGGDNGFVYVLSLIGVPVAAGVLAGFDLIRFWHAVLGCLAVVILDVVFDEKRSEDAVFFAVLAVLMVAISALARFVTRWVARRRHPDNQGMGRSSHGVAHASAAGGVRAAGLSGHTAVGATRHAA
jgi:hypothetical protein